MSAQFNGTNSYLSYDNVPILTYPYTFGAWMHIPSAGTVMRTLFSYSYIAAPDHFLYVGMNASELMVLNVAAGGTEFSTNLSSLSPPTWLFVLCRAISSSNRRISTVTDKGVAESAVSAGDVPHNAPDTLTLGAHRTSAGASRFHHGAIAEFWITKGDVGHNTGAHLTTQALFDLAYKGPFANALISNKIIDYKSFRQSPTGEGNLGDEYFSEGISAAGVNPTGKRYNLSNVNGVTTGINPPLPYYYKRPNHSKFQLLNNFRSATDTQTRLILRKGEFSPFHLSPTAWYDPSDLSTLFQDAAGTTPVTADGDVVGLMQDKSGNGNHLTQATTANKPRYKTSGGLHWLEFDGTDDFLTKASFTPSGDKVQTFAGVWFDNLTNQHTIFETSADSQANAGSITLFLAGPVDDKWRFRGRGSINTSVTSTGVASANTSYVASGLGDISGDSTKVRINAAETSSSADNGTGNFLTYDLYVGRRGGTTNPLDGRLYGLFIRFGSTLSDTQVSKMEAWMAGKSGVTL